MADRGSPDGICIAFGQNWSTTSPTWTRLDDPNVPVWGFKAGTPHNTNCVSGWTVDRGRSYELDKTQTGTATITLQDPHGWFDPTNAASPFYGKLNVMLPASISIYDPNNNFYTCVFTGFVESWNWTTTIDEKLMIVTVNLVDGFEILGQAELVPSINGVTVLAGDSSNNAIQNRMVAVLNTPLPGGVQAWPDDGLLGANSRWRNINSGNSFIAPTVYNPSTTVLSVLQDCADAEFPGVANVFMNKIGAISFYGRYVRFQPSNYPLDVKRWTVGDRGGQENEGAAVANDIEWTEDTSKLINSVLCYPNKCPQIQILNQLYTDTSSITKYGNRSIAITDLLSFGQPGTANQTAQPATMAGALACCLYFAKYYVKNYSVPNLRITKLQFGSRPTGDSQTWLFIASVEIGDLLTVWTTNAGGGGFGVGAGEETPTQFFVEGIHYVVSGPLFNEVPEVQLTLDVSPKQWFENQTWT